jgi:hypothetical protein
VRPYFWQILEENLTIGKISSLLAKVENIAREKRKKIFITIKM